MGLFIPQKTKSASRRCYMIQLFYWHFDYKLKQRVQGEFLHHPEGQTHKNQLQEYYTTIYSVCQCL